jgi:hypothetical protein
MAIKATPEFRVDIRYTDNGHERHKTPPQCTISLLSFLEAENVRLRQAVVELSLDAKALLET